ncbi:hypothetical protein IHE49_11205 [Rhodanobacter sp. 7MK24]|uniref:hypothetical protein n=1 Tax=Rhodanobacter sp. 7MK24 TaxID=2775922 RepID=UPI001784D7E4|nr:hypothetical protein [Rhodanobacter sp. 7MK24]MBD8881046.1 hypothetical protein [Rhodanobacter sp. 7MK24]
MALLGLTLAVPALLVLFTSDKDQGALLLGALLFGLVALLFGRRALYRKPVLVVDAQGMTLPSYGLVPWDDIDRVGVAPGQAVLIFPKRPEAWQSRLPTFYALMWRLFPKRRCLGVSLQNVDTLTPTIYDAIKTHLASESTGSGLLVLKRGYSAVPIS